MRPSPLLLALPFALSLAACLAPAEPTDPDPPVAAVDDGGMCEAESEADVCEDVGEAEDALNACHIGCAAVLALGCPGVIALCTAGEVPSAGSIIVPCTIAVTIACSIGAEGCYQFCGG